jgi:hypothetical protein
MAMATTMMNALAVRALSIAAGCIVSRSLQRLHVVGKGG